ncbi:MAG: glycosyl transferase family 1, partial [Chthonomonadales bacterium]|nr:glycosyl transferase family 1 [Chthonomonadales bacterium]
DQREITYIGFVLGHGGDAGQMLDLAAGMAARGRRVRVVVPVLETTVRLAEQGAERGVLVERSPLVRADPRGAQQSQPDLLELLSRHRNALLHFHTGDVCLPRPAQAALRQLDLRGFATLHSPYDTVPAGSERAIAWAAAVEHSIHAVVCPSEHGREKQLRNGVPAERVRTIPNGIDTRRFASGDAKAAWQALDVTSETLLLVFTSRLDAQKRPLDALTAFRGVAAEFPALHLVYVGQGEQEARVRQVAAESGISERVHLMGFRSDVPDWLAAATVWMLPTEAENFSLSVLEALAAGCPILSTDCPGNDEVLRDGDNSLLTAVGDTETQTEALRRLLSDAGLRERLSAAARRDAEKYRLERMIESYAALYRHA